MTKYVVCILALTASTMGAQDTVARTRSGTPVVTMPRRTRAEELKFRKDSAARPDSFALKIFRGATDRDSDKVHVLATRLSPRPRDARVTHLVFRGDTADVTMFTGTLEQRLRFVRRDSTWALVPNPPGVGGR